MLSRANLSILALALLAAIAGGGLQHVLRPARLPSGADEATVGGVRPDLALLDLSGHERRLSDYRGKRLLLNFWAPWCGPCRDEMPALKAAQRRFADDGARVLGIAMDEPGRVHAYLTAHPLNYPILLGQLDAPSTALRLGDVDEVLPYSVLLDENAKILAVHRGPLDAAQLTLWLAPNAAP